MTQEQDAPRDMGDSRQRATLRAHRKAGKRGNMPDQEQGQREIAYFLWQEAGRPDGMDLDFWLAAQQRKPAGDQSRDNLGAIDASRDEVKLPASSKPEVTGSPVAKKKKRHKR